MVVVKKKLLNVILKIKFYKKMQKLSTVKCLKKKKKENKNMQKKGEGKKSKLKEYQRSYQVEKKIIFLYNIKMSEKTLRFGNVETNKKEFYGSKQTVALNLVDTDKIVISDKFW